MSQIFEPDLIEEEEEDTEKEDIDELIEEMENEEIRNERAARRELKRKEAYELTKKDLASFEKSKEKVLPEQMENFLSFMQSFRKRFEENFADLIALEQDH
jgi:hypothetical protein